jgi:hypothetical protein
MVLLSWTTRSYLLGGLETSMMYDRRTYEWTSILSTAAMLCSYSTSGVCLSGLPKSTSQDSGRLPMAMAI